MRDLLDRDQRLDALRGGALLAVILVNLITEYASPLMLYIKHFHTAPGFLNHSVDWVVGLALEGKGLAVLSALFGYGIASLTERYSGVVYNLLARRYAALLFLGVLHLVFVFSGDILTLYALCGFLTLPLSACRPRTIIFAMICLVMLRLLLSQFSIPYDTEPHLLIENSYRFYSSGSYIDVLKHRLFEIKHLILPLLLTIFPRVLFMFLFGILAWRLKWVEYARSKKFSPWIWRSFLIIGVLMTSLGACLATQGISLGIAEVLIGDLGIFGLALTYSLLFLRAPVQGLWVRVLAPLGRMSLTVYLSQTVFLGLLFYGYGLGWFGQIEPFQAFCLGICIYCTQLVVCHLYLRKYSYGPLEWALRRIYLRTL